MRDLENSDQTLAGRILVADPNLNDLNFKQSVILVSGHDTEKGAMGIIINKPTGELLGQVRPELADSSLKDIPVFRGGPVNSKELILAAWKWNLDQQSFQLFFGLEPDRLQELKVEYPDLICRAFAGYSGWEKDQLEAELVQEDWHIATFGVYYKNFDSEKLWREFIYHLMPEQRHLGDLPEDPSLN